MNWKKLLHPQATLEQRILQLSILAASFINLVGITIALFMGQELWMVMQGYVSVGIFTYAYYLTRFRGKHRTAASLFALMGWIILTLAWITNDGSRGPVLIMLAFAGLIIIVSIPREWRKLMAVGLWATMLGLFAIEWWYPETILQYPTELARAADVYILVGFVVFPGLLVLATYVINSYDNARDEAEAERNLSDRLLHAILPTNIAASLRQGEKVKPESYDQLSILFTDFVGFSRISEKLSAGELVSQLDSIFSLFDEVAERHGVERIKTIGDSYMAVTGLDLEKDHAKLAVQCGLDLQTAVADYNKESPIGWQMRCGIHSGPVVAGVIGKDRHAYDIWGDAVNTASRLESVCLPGLVNVSADTKALCGDLFTFESRGLIEIKNKDPIEVFTVSRPAN